MFLFFSILLLFFYIFTRHQAFDIRKISDDGWVLYHSKTCMYCIKQLKYISWKRIWLNEVEYSKNPRQCREMNIRVFPTWVNIKTGDRHEGSIEYDQLVSTLLKQKS